MDAEPTLECRQCGETVSVNATRCDGCGGLQPTSRLLVFLVGGLGAVFTPISVIALLVAVSGAAGLVGTLILLSVGLTGPFFLFLGVSGWKHRREMLSEAAEES